jgi:hypothetical protein
MKAALKAKPYPHCPRSVSSTKRLVDLPAESPEIHNSGGAFLHSHNCCGVLHQKDLNLALEGARVLGLSLPSTAVAQQMFSSCAAHGGRAWDHSALVRALEMMASYEIAAV